MRPRARQNRRSTVAAALLLGAALGVAPAWAQTVSTSTTTTLFTGTTTTTMFIPTDVSGGGDFEGGFPANSFDSYVFELTGPRVLLAEVTNGFGGCPGDTYVELRRPGAPGNCNGTYGDDLLCVAADDDSGISLCSKLVKRIPEPGPYEIRVKAYGGAKLNRYFLHVEFVQTTCGDAVLELAEECDDGNVEQGDCCSPSCDRDAAGTACGDGVFCNGADTCTAGAVCGVHAGDPCSGADGDGNCSETCNEAVDACSAADPDASACDDGLFCNGADTCSNGICSSHAGDPCSGVDSDGDCAESCSEAGDDCAASDPNGSPCDDGVFCNGADTCSAGACSVHPGNPCAGSDGDLDCAETCDDTADACTGADPDESACTDGLFCNGTDSCLSGLCSVHSTPQCTGPDGDADCAESCSDQAGGCTGHDPNGSPCNDGVYCNGPDNCSNGSCSVHAGDPCSGPDGDGSCTESCNETADACTAADPNGSPCSDGVYCNGADTCAAGACSGHAGNPCTGPDGDGNCAESCSEAADNCAAADPDASACDDGLFCNGADTCAGGTCGAHAGSPCAGADGDGNCSESCSEAADNCAAADPNGSACDDGSACTATSACNAAGSCVGGTVSCGDGNACTTDACTGQACSHTPIAGCTTTTTTTLSSSVCGDVTGDGFVKASDALSILKFAVGGSQCTGRSCICDASGNGSVTASDALIVLKFAVGAPVSLLCAC